MILGVEDLLHYLRVAHKELEVKYEDRTAAYEALTASHEKLYMDHRKLEQDYKLQAKELSVKPLYEALKADHQKVEMERDTLKAENDKLKTVKAENEKLKTLYGKSLATTVDLMTRQKSYDQLKEAYAALWVLTKQITMSKAQLEDDEQALRTECASLESEIAHKHPEGAYDKPQTSVARFENIRARVADMMNMGALKSAGDKPATKEPALPTQNVELGDTRAAANTELRRSNTELGDTHAPVEDWNDTDPEVLDGSPRKRRKTNSTQSEESQRTPEFTTSSISSVSDDLERWPQPGTRVFTSTADTYPNDALFSPYRDRIREAELVLGGPLAEELPKVSFRPCGWLAAKDTTEWVFALVGEATKVDKMWDDYLQDFFDGLAKEMADLQRHMDSIDEEGCSVLSWDSQATASTRTLSDHGEEGPQDDAISAPPPRDLALKAVPEDLRLTPEATKRTANVKLADSDMDSQLFKPVLDDWVKHREERPLALGTDPRYPIFVAREIIKAVKKRVESADWFFSLPLDFQGSAAASVIVAMAVRAGHLSSEEGKDIQTALECD